MRDITYILCIKSMIVFVTLFILKRDRWMTMNYRDNFTKELKCLIMSVSLSDREIRGCEYANIDYISFVIHILCLLLVKVHRHQISIRCDGLLSSSSLSLTLDLCRRTWYHPYSLLYAYLLPISTYRDGSITNKNDMMQSIVVIDNKFDRTFDRKLTKECFPLLLRFFSFSVFSG